MPRHNHDTLESTTAWVDSLTKSSDPGPKKPRAAIIEHGDGLVRTRPSFWRLFFGTGKSGNNGGSLGGPRDHHAHANSPVMVKKGFRWMTPATATKTPTMATNSTYSRTSAPPRIGSQPSLPRSNRTYL